MSTPTLRAATARDAEERAQTPLRFERDSSLLCEFEVFGSARDEDGATRIEVEIALLLPDGSLLTRGSPIPIPASRNGRLRPSVAVNLKGVPDGAFVLRVTVRDKIAGKASDATTEFEVGAPRAGGDAYLALVADYRQGRRASAVRALGGWAVAEVESALAAPAWAETLCDAACRRSAALLETDLAFSLLWAFRTQEADRHLVLARRLLDPWEPPSLFQRDWLLTLGQAHRAVGDPLAACQPLQECTRRFPADASCQLVLAEAREDLTFQAVHLASPLAATGQGEVNQVQATLALGAFQRTLELAPDWDRAHLALARYRARRGDPGAAQLEADWVIQHGEAPATRARARLLLGALDEQRKHPEAAISSYRAAVEDAPTSQAARIALSHALYGVGRRAAAAQQVRAVLDATEASQPADAWLAGWIDATFERDRLFQKLVSESRLP